MTDHEHEARVAEYDEIYDEVHALDGSGLTTAPVSDPVDAQDEFVRDVLVDCMTSFGIHGDNARDAAEYILSADSGLRVFDGPGHDGWVETCEQIVARDRGVAAEALRDAARAASGRWNVKPYVDQWLIARADAVEAGEVGP